MKCSIVFLAMALFFETGMTGDRDLKAELIILPPLILGYDELMEEKTEANEVTTSKDSSNVRQGPSTNPRKSNSLNSGDSQLQNILAAQLNMDDSRRSDIVNDLGKLLRQNMLASSKGPGKSRRSDDYEVQNDLDQPTDESANALGKLLQLGLLGAGATRGDKHGGDEASENADANADYMLD